MDKKEKLREYYKQKSGYICFFCKVKCTKFGSHNKSLEHFKNMAIGLNVPIELLLP